MKSNIYSSQAGFVPLVVIVIMGIVGAGGIATVASQNSLPGDALYAVKEMTENVELAVSLGEENKAKVHLAIAEKRLNEIEALRAKGASSVKIQNTTEKMLQNQERAQKRINEAYRKGRNVEEVVIILQTNLDRQQTALIEVLEKVPEEAQNAIQEAIIKSQSGLQEAMEIKYFQPEQSDTPSDLLKNEIQENPSTNKPDAPLIKKPETSKGRP